jgi:plastocyanin
MKTLSRIGLALASIAAIASFGSLAVTAQVKSNDNKIAVVDNCLPGDPGWTPTGGCLLNENQGDVPFAEFGALLTSPLTIPANGILIGHPSWRMEPAHLTAPTGKGVKITNSGGRAHTFTEVANFGGGFVPQLNIGLQPAPECLSTTNPPLRLEPGDSIELTATGAGLHKFECCIHPWMRATIRVE